MPANPKKRQKRAMEAEQAVLGAIMLDNGAYWHVCDLVRDVDFYLPNHQLIFRAIADLLAKEMPCDAVTLGGWFETQGVSELIGGTSYVIELANATPSAANARAYAEIVASEAEIRRINTAGTKIAILDTEDAGSSAMRLLGEAVRIRAEQIEPIGKILTKSFEGIQDRYQNKGAIIGYTTGLPKLDDFTSGFQPTDLIVICGRPGMGKTALGLQLAIHQAKNVIPALFFSLEMSKVQLTDRAISHVSGVPFSRIRASSTLEEYDWPRLTAAFTSMKTMPLHIDETCAIRLESLSGKVRQMHDRHGVKIVFIDYLQYMEPPKAETEASGIQVITRGLKNLAKSLGIVVVVLAQLNRDVEKRQDKRPLMSDLKQSGAIEQDADIVMACYRDSYYNPTSHLKGYAELLILKQRNGESGTVPMIDNLACMKFEHCEALPTSKYVDDAEPRQRPKGSFGARYKKLYPRGNE